MTKKTNANTHLRVEVNMSSEYQEEQKAEPPQSGMMAMKRFCWDNKITYREMCMNTQTQTPAQLEPPSQIISMTIHYSAFGERRVM